MSEEGRGTRRCSMLPARMQPSTAHCLAGGPPCSSHARLLRACMSTGTSGRRRRKAAVWGEPSGE